MRIGKKSESRYVPGKSIFEEEKELRKKAIELSKNHIDKKPIKYLLKR